MMKPFLSHMYGRAGTVLFLVAAVLLLNVPAHGEMYICREKSGSFNFTNVRNSPSCKPYRAKSSSRKKWGWVKPAKNINQGRYDREIGSIGRRYNVDPPLIKAIIHTESAFNHRAISRSGAQGLMQLMPATARELRVKNPFNPRENIDGGTRYFRKMLDSFNGNLILSLAAYNAGPGLVKRYGGVPRIPETRKYVNKVLKRYKVYKATW
jgi:soluble lytic murein transglycosylase-like protein